MPITVWEQLADVWELCENQGMATSDLNQVKSSVVSPVLVIGAGQGLLLQVLANWGLDASGIDFSPSMCRRAFERRRILVNHGDAKAVPYTDRTFKSTLISTGVLNPNDQDECRQIIREALRVTGNSGTVIICFASPSCDEYRPHKRLATL